MSKTSLFDIGPERLSRLLSIGKEKLDADDDSKAKSSEPTSGEKIPVEKPGSWIGRYKLIRMLGEGGMGEVYLAEQEHPIKRQVALKIIKPGMDSKRVITRFEAERQALALLDHPNIAHVYDAGTTEAGRPYFVMEYVKGLSITEHCDHHKLNIDQRLRLFQQVCQAVQHAHQKGIIHRDIKPSNILVSMQDGKAVPKIIDFGVAKALSQPLTERTLATEDSQLLGTPEYMSPEQADMASEDIDTRSDIYSLGVLLYVLLTGVLPFDSTTFRTGGLESIRQIIRETDPKTPSTRLVKLGEKARKLAENRRTELATLTKCLHRELEWIPLKAMRKERAERYRSASELADDIDNYLKGVPLIAGPPGTGYKLKKFVRRNKVLVGGIAAVLVVLLAGVIASTLFAIRAERARSHAQAVSDFLQHNVIQSFDPYRVGGRKITIRSAFDAASASLEGKFADMPLTEADIRRTLGGAYWSLGLYEEAELHTRRALDIQQAQLGAEHPATLASINNLGWVCYYQNRNDEAAALFSMAVQQGQLMLGEDYGTRLYSMLGLGCVYNMQGRFQQAEELIAKALETVRRELGREHQYVPVMMSNLAWSYQLQGRYDEAERLLTRGIEISRSVRGERDWETLWSIHRLGEVFWQQGRYGDAEQVLTQVLDARRQFLGEEHSDTLLIMASLGWLYSSQGRYEEAESLFVKTRETARAKVGKEHICLHSMHGLGTLYLSQGRYDEAGPLLEESLKVVRKLLGEGNWYTLKVTNTLAKLYMAKGHYEEAEKTFRQVLEARKLKLGDEHPETLETLNDFGVLRREQKNYPEAEKLLSQALEGRQLKLGNDHPACFESMHELAVLYKEQDRYEEAEELLKKAIEGRHLKLGDTHPHTLESLNNLITLYEAWNEPEEAEKWRTKLPQIEALRE